MLQITAELATDPIFAILLHSAPPAISPTQAADLVQRYWGIQATAQTLACERDASFRLQTPQGQAYVLKVANAAEPAEQTDLQTQALLWLERRAPELRVPQLVAGRDGTHTVAVTMPDGRIGRARLLDWVPGVPLAQHGQGAGAAAQIGALLARLGLALREFRHPAAAHEILWDIRHAARLLPLIQALPKTTPSETALRDGLLAELDHFEARVLPCLRGLRWQVVHNDMNHHNLLVDPEDPARLSGVLDFGDVVQTPLIIDVAVAASYLVHGAADPLVPVLDLLRAYHQRVPLRPSEVFLLRDLIVARLMTSVVIGQTRARLYPQNAAYILRNQAAAQDGLTRFAALPPQMVTATFLHALR